MKTLAHLVIWVAIVTFSLVGLSGVLFGPWEFTWSFPMRFDGLDAPQRATLFNQMRFFKALELGLGLFLFAIRRDLFHRRGLTAVTAAVLWATPLARLISWRLDGPAILPFQLLTGVELAGALVFTLALLTGWSGQRQAAVRS